MRLSVLERGTILLMLRSAREDVSSINWKRLFFAVVQDRADQHLNRREAGSRLTDL